MPSLNIANQRLLASYVPDHKSCTLQRPVAPSVSTAPEQFPVIDIHLTDPKAEEYASQSTFKVYCIKHIFIKYRTQRAEKGYPEGFGERTQEPESKLAA